MTTQDAQGATATNPVWLTLAAALLGNALVFLFPLMAAALDGRYDTLYYGLVQEDGVLEWMTFWAFLFAAVGYWRIAWLQRAAACSFPWLTAVLALGCFLIAMEEISWGQRVLGYRPPEYFLQENFQQELNLHNIFSTSIRKLVLKSIILGYGVVLPLLALIKPLRPALVRYGPQVPPLALMPAFAVTFVVYQAYPWQMSGELVELMLGLGFLFSAATALPARGAGLAGGSARIVAAFAVAALLAGATFAGFRLIPANDPGRIAAARTELQALAADWQSAGKLISSCSVHKRVFSWVRKYRPSGRLAHSNFADLEGQGLPEARARYYIDPWNSPIWIRHKCRRREGREAAFLYSYGPNRQRDSSDWQIGGDDIGVVLLQRGVIVDD